MPYNPYLQETLQRQADGMLMLNYGVGFLDDALTGIMPSELIVIAGRTGIGKTELAISIAKYNATRCNVWLMALEAESLEVQRRMKYQLIAKEFFANRNSFPADLNLNYSDWACDRYGDKLIALDHLASEVLQEQLQNLTIFQPDFSEFQKSDFCAVYEEAVRKGARLVILDHIHYIAADKKEHEYDHVRQTMWRLREMINKHRVPIIAFSHLHKESKADKNWVPTLDDLHGSSEISKQANQVIAFAPCYALPSSQDKSKMVNQSAGTTLCRVLKSRRGQIAADRYIALMKFNLDTRSYSENYIPFGTDRFSNTLEPLKYESFERWMQGNGRESKI